MSLDPALSALLTDTIALASATSISNSGQPAFAAATSYAARVEEDPQLLERRSQEDGALTQLQTTHVVYLDSTREPLVGDRLWLPGDSSSDPLLAREVRQVTRLPGLTTGTTSHYEVRV
jgi:hypothetical protein